MAFITGIVIMVIIMLIMAILYFLKKSKKEEEEHLKKIKDCTLKNKKDVIQDKTKDKLIHYLKELGYTPTYIVISRDVYTVTVAENNIEYIEYTDIVNDYSQEEDIIFYDYNFDTFVSLEDRKMLISKLYSAFELKPLLDKCRTFINEISKYLNIIDTCITPDDILIVDTDNICIKYSKDKITMKNHIVTIKEEFEPNQFQKYLNKFNKMIDFFYDDIILK